MKLTTIMAKAIFLFAPFFVLVSCSDDDNEPSTSDFGIISTETFEVISSYENGWIQEAISYDISGNKLAEIEYHANGFIKSCNVYTPRVDDIPVHTLTVSRDASNQPVQAIYYNADGSVLAEINYQNGLLKDKTVYKPSFTIVSTYTDGEIQKQVCSSDDGVVSTITYDNTNQERQIQVMNNNVLAYETILPLLPVAGEGVNTANDQVQKNRFEGEETNDNTLNSSFASSISWEGLYDLREIQPPSKVYDLFSTYSLPNGYFSKDFDYYRMAMEEYPFIESEILLGKFYLLENVISVKNSITISEEISNEIAADADAFKFQYGDQYLSDIIYGKYGFVIGSIRNLPTDFQL